jgi:hypothetical protein
MAQEAMQSSRGSADGKYRGIIEWLALANGRTGCDDADQLLRQVSLLREAAIPAGQRVRLLDLLFEQAERIVLAQLPLLLDVTLPVSRKIRYRVGIIQEFLDVLIEEYSSTLSGLFDPQTATPVRPPQETLGRIMTCIAWHIRISHLVASPNAAGIWQQLHAAYRSARRLGLAETPGPDGQPTIQQSYLHVLLAAIAQPASFCSSELDFITDYVASCVLPVDILENPPQDRTGVFWIALDSDYPAQALARRAPPADTFALYFACDIVARDTRQHLAALAKGAPASSLGLPDFADKPAGRGVLRRLSLLWGKPATRKFQRRRQSYRVTLCAGLEQLWQLMRHPETEGPLSEWMVTNESPDGYSLMHMSGETSHLRVGDIVAVRSTGEHAEEPVQNWHVGIVRWAISENPEHIELGMQQLAAGAIAAQIIRPVELEAGKLAALILPEMPPLRSGQALVAPTGQLGEQDNRLIVLVERENVEIHEVRPTALTEQTSSIEVFSVEPQESDGQS